MSKQLFQRGDHVKIDDDLGPSMRHFQSGVEAIVIGSYVDQYGGVERDQHSYTLHIKGHGQVSWYHESQLTLIEKNRMDLLQKWEEEAAVLRKQESDLDWIFSPEHAHGDFKLPADSAQALFTAIGLGSLWGTHGEGWTWARNYALISEFAWPWIRTNDKDGFLQAGAQIKIAIAMSKAPKPEPCTPPFHPPVPEPEPVPADKEE